MSWLDYAIIGVICISIGWGVWRGLMREFMSLAGWVIAFFAANAAADPLGGWLPISARPEVRVLIAFAVVFVATLSVAALAGMLLSKLFQAAGLSGVDRTLGGLFGLGRGIVILLVVTIAVGFTTLPHNALWKESVGAGMLERTVVQLKPWLPPALAARLKYN
jgi:membrane protein required for colicin V production